MVYPLSYQHYDLLEEVALNVQLILPSKTGVGELEKLLTFQ